jgi:DNA-directed RNA polymerase subunit RPC12/RpoP
LGNLWALSLFLFLLLRGDFYIYSTTHHFSALSAGKETYVKTKNIDLVCPECGSSHIEHIEDYVPVDEERAYKCVDCGEEFVITVSFQTDEAQVAITYRSFPLSEPKGASSAACSAG